MTAVAEGLFRDVVQQLWNHAVDIVDSRE